MEDTPVRTGYIRVTIERGGEQTITDVPEGSTVGALIEQGHLRGVAVASTRVNGLPATGSTPISDGDTASEVPKSGKQG